MIRLELLPLSLFISVSITLAASSKLNEIVKTGAERERGWISHEKEY